MKRAEENRDIEKAMVYMVTAIQESGNNPKPVILHSVRVFSLLDILGYEKDILIAALLHDCIEDTDTTEENLEMAFGKEVAELVKANSFDVSIEDATEQYKELFGRCKEKGKNALVIKAADFYDNMDYYEKTGPYEKAKYFITIAEEELQHEPIHKKLTEKYKTLTAKHGLR